MNYAQHVADIAAAFNVRLDIRNGMPLEASGAGYVIIPCPQCGRQNALRRAGTHRCGACKHPLGEHLRVQSVTIAPVTDEASYAVAMHELGHCLHPTGRVNEFEGSRTMRLRNQVATLRDMRLQLLEESSAWEWARMNTRDWTPTMQHVETLAMGTYRTHARRLGLKL